MPESTLTRIYNKIENIDEYNINKFWEQKAINTSSYNAVLLNANLSQDANSIRNKNERDFLFSYLKNKKYNIYYRIWFTLLWRLRSFAIYHLLSYKIWKADDFI